MYFLEHLYIYVWNQSKEDVNCRKSAKYCLHIYHGCCRNLAAGGVQIREISLTGKLQCTAYIYHNAATGNQQQVLIRMEVASLRPDYLPTLSAAKTSKLSPLVNHHILAIDEAS